MCVRACVRARACERASSPGPALSTFLGGSRVARLAPHKQEKEIAPANYGYLPVCVCVSVCV